MTDTKIIATELRRHIVRMTTKAKSGHATSSLSCADILVVLFAKHLRYDPSLPSNIYNDRFILSKGHAAPALYAIYALAGWIRVSELDYLRQKGSVLEGHPMPSLPFVDVATGSLGQGLAVGMGMSRALQDLSPESVVYVLMGDSEMSEGSVWEAMAVASKLQLKNIVAIIDYNSLGQASPPLCDYDTLAKRVASFGWEVITVDGHSHEEVDAALVKAKATPGLFCIIAKTIKGKGAKIAEGLNGWHAKPFTETELAEIEKDLGPAAEAGFQVARPEKLQSVQWPIMTNRNLTPTFSEPTSSKQGFGQALADLAALKVDFTILDADVKNSIMTDMAEGVDPSKLIELSIAESTMIGMATGLGILRKRTVAATFGAFLTRCFDQLRLAALSEASFVLNGSYAGVSIGRDGASQMGLSDIAQMRQLPKVTLLYPSDAFSAYSLTISALAQKSSGIVYLRTSREPTSPLYSPMTKFPVGGCQVHGGTSHDTATVVAAGVTLFEALKAKEVLGQMGISIRVIDLYSVVPMDVATLRHCLSETKGNLVVVEDHYQAGGIGEAVFSAIPNEHFSQKFHLFVSGIPHSMGPSEQLETHRIDAAAIVETVKNIKLR